VLALNLCCSTFSQDILSLICYCLHTKKNYVSAPYKILCA